MEKARQLALEGTGGHALSNIMVERKNKYVLPLFIQSQITVTGTVVTYTNPGGNIKTKRKENTPFRDMINETQKTNEWMAE